MTNIVIAVLLAICVLITNYVAVRVTLHPAQTSNEKDAYKVLILFVGFCSVGLIGFQAYRSYLSTEDFKHLVNQEGTDIHAIREDANRPIQVNVPPIKLPQAPANRVPKQDKKAELKMQGLELSADISAFAFARRNAGLDYLRFAEIMPRATDSPGDWEKRYDAEQKRVKGFSDETLNLYRTEFEQRALALLQEMNANGIDVGQAWYRPGSTESIQKFAIDLATVAKNVH